MNQAFLTKNLIGKLLAAPYDAVRFVFHLPRLLVLIHRLFKDRRVPIHIKALPLLAVVYIIWPLEILKDFVRGPIGYLDDAIVTYYLLKTFVRLCPPEVVAEHVARLSLPPEEVSRESRPGE